MQPDAPMTQPRGGFFLHVMPALLYVAAVFYAGSVSVGPAVQTEHGDKLIHAIAFAGMQLIVFRALRFELPEVRSKWQLLWAALISSGVGAALECYQIALRHRSAEWLDWVADTVGAAVAAAMLYWGLFRSDADEGAVPRQRRDSQVV
jgi:VanZ family protein